MTNLDIALMGLGNLFRRKTRTILTVLGVVIGTSSILVMISIGIGMDKTFEESIGQYGSLTTITIHNRNYGGGGQETQKKLDDKVVEEFTKLKHVKSVVPMGRANAQLKVKRYEGWGEIRLIRHQDMEKLDIKLASGRMPKENPEGVEVVVGSYIPKSFYDPRARRRSRHAGPPAMIEVDPYKDRISIVPHGAEANRPRGLNIIVVGVTTETDYENSHSIIVDFDKYKEFERRFNRRYKVRQDRQKQRNQSKYSMVKINVNKVDNVEGVQEKIKKMGYEPSSLGDWLAQTKKTTAMIQGVLGAVGGVSLLVAAIGIANTMIMSIYERTREIGVMKVIGAQIKDIRRLFLFEAGMIGLFGGVFGVGLSYGISAIINKLGSASGAGGGGGDASMMLSKSILPPSLILFGLGFAVMIGIVAGYYPATRATKLSALEAIRSE